MRRSYGKTWWGQQWLNALNEIDEKNRLPRGRTYARNGSVWELDTDNNNIFAKVKGKHISPYKINIRLSAFTEAEKSKMLNLISHNPAMLSRLLNRELPQQLFDACAREGIELFPSAWSDLEGSCNCPDEAAPCKHIAAVLYLLANEIDKNPFLIFELHNFNLFEGLEEIGFAEQGQQNVSVQTLDSLWQEYEPEDEFEWNREQYEQLDFSKIPNCQEKLLVLLNEKPLFFPEGDFKAALSKVYTSVAKNVKKRLTKESSPELTAIMDATEEVEIILNEEGDLLVANLRNSRGKSIEKFQNIEAVVDWLQRIPLNHLERFSMPLRGLALMCHLAEKLAVKSAYIPQLLSIDGIRFRVRWLPALLNEEVKKVFEQVKALTQKDMLYYKVEKAVLQPVHDDYHQALLSLMLSQLVHANHELDEKYLISEVGYLFFYGSPERFQTYEDKEYPTAIQLWLSRLYLTHKSHVPVIFVEDKGEAFHLSIGFQQQDGSSEASIMLEEILNNNKYSHMRLEVLRDLSSLIDYFPQISELLNSNGTQKLVFDTEAFVPVLLNILPTMQLFGVKVKLPRHLRKLVRPKVSMALQATGLEEVEEDETGSVGASSAVSLENMLRFDWKVAIGNELVSKDDFLKQVKQFSGIVKMNEQYVYFNEKEIQAIIDQLENPPELDSHKLLQTALTEEYEGASIQMDTSVRTLIDQLMKSEETKLPQGLKATLRPYQLRGYEWLYKNARLGFGSLIADDMGLGKTLQVITTLLKLKEDGQLGPQKGIIIVPTTLLTNWQKEIQKFAPDLKPLVYHGPNRDLKALDSADLLITTYGILRTESAKLQKRKWLLIVIDEAQNIKNPTTSQTKLVKKIKAPIRIAMSGTPVENRLSEYWSIFDFSNKGYLGGLKKFKDQYARPIEIDRDQYQLDRFRKITEPFILRRLKTDKTIIKDLPDKIEKDQFCQLTTDQAALYQNVLDNTLQAISEAEGINRKGLVLKLITALKQVCNHPRHFLKRGPNDPALSGKSQLLLSLLTHTLDTGEKSLIFTQYKEMGNMIAQMIQDKFGLEVPFLHGGVSRDDRDEMVEEFQHDRSTKILLLSLKAGGTGLNLTSASNVIHYDLWWNPAVEAQATDRAYRIGQTKNVLVHRFITQGTFEEKINRLLHSKKELANLTVASGEKWIGDLTTDELSALVALG